MLKDEMSLRNSEEKVFELLKNMVTKLLGHFMEEF